MASTRLFGRSFVCLHLHAIGRHVQGFVWPTTSGTHSAERLSLLLI